MKLVHEIAPGIFLPFPSGRALRKFAATETVIVRREDGSERREERDCEPYPVEIRPAEVVLAWSRQEREVVGIFEAEVFTAPAGTRKTGAPRYRRVDGKVVEEYDTEPLPPPPSDQEKFEAFASGIGLDGERLANLIARHIERDAGKPA